MADEFNIFWSQIQKYISEADADLVPVPGQLELHGRYRCGVLLAPCFSALVVADLIAGMEELELHYRWRGRLNFQKVRIATIAVSQERQGVPARWGDPARGIPTAKLPTVRESHEPGPPLEPGPPAPCPSQRGAEGGEGSRPKGGVPARRGVGVPARGILRPIRCQAAWEYHEPGPPTSRDPSHFRR